MKRLSLSLLAGACLTLCPAPAQAQEGTVTYEETTKMTFELPPEMEHLREEIPSARTIIKQLFFNESASLMKNAPREEEAADHVMPLGEDGLHFTMSTEEPEDETYVTFDEGQLLEKKDFLGRTFLITGARANLAWRLTNERSEFLGYMSQKATALHDSTTIEAWFTPEIPVPAGPAHYGGLPGLILVLTVNDGQRTFVAQALSLAPLDDAVLAPPTQGNMVTRDAFEAIVAEKMKEMEVEGKGNVFIMRGN